MSKRRRREVLLCAELSRIAWAGGRSGYDVLLEAVEWAEVRGWGGVAQNLRGWNSQRGSEDDKSMRYVCM